MNITVIGLGGVGSILVERMSRFLNYTAESEAKMLFVDGDTYEPKNYERQEFSQMGNKADIKVSDLAIKFPNIDYDSYPAYINEANTADVIKDGTIVFMCVDNHKSRNIINNYCKVLNNVTLISGGNEWTDGNVQLYVRRDGKDLTPDIAAYHPEIATPDDKLPEEQTCEQLADSAPQLYFANLGVATLMCWAFYNAIMKEQYTVSEAYFDMLQMATVAHTRAVK